MMPRVLLGTIEADVTLVVTPAGAPAVAAPAAPAAAPAAPAPAVAAPLFRFWAWGVAHRGVVAWAIVALAALVLVWALWPTISRSAAKAPATSPAAVQTAAVNKAIEESDSPTAQLYRANPGLDRRKVLIRRP